LAGSSFFALFDDIALLLDDVAVLTKVAAKKTAGVLGDDLALNANQVAGVAAERELPVVWAVARGSLVNKLILVPVALALSAFLPKFVLPLLMLGGLYLCFEGAEKIAHKFFHPKSDVETEHAKHLQALADSNVDMVAFERDKIKGAVRTDFILSAEILVIALSTVSSKPFLTQVLVLASIAVAMTIGVYGLVAAIVKIDDAGYWMLKRPQKGAQMMGRTLVASAPVFMKFLSIAGTAAMFLVGGSILLHGIPGSHDWLHHITNMFVGIPAGPLLASMLIEGLVGLLAGAICVVLFTAVQKMRGKAHAA
jgi:uncharacterized protein